MRTTSLALFVMLLCLGCRQSGTTVAPSPERSGAVGPVTFQIVDGDKVTTVIVEEVAVGETLESVMRRVVQPQISIRGEGVTAFVDQIGDRATNTSEGWTYRIDGEFATRGIGESMLTPPTTVQWSFGSMPDNEASP